MLHFHWYFMHFRVISQIILVLTDISRYFWGIQLVSKTTRFSVMRSWVTFMMGTEGSNIFEINTCTLLEKALKALPSHFNFKQFFAFYFFGRQILGVDTAYTVVKSHWICCWSCFFKLFVIHIV